MKKFLALSIIAATFSMIACDPIEDRNEMIGGVASADQLNISATPIVRDGVNSNYIHLQSDGNACLSSWDYGFGSYVGTNDTVQVMLAGDNEIIYTGLNADGTTVTKKLIVKVERLYDVAPEWTLFCGDSGVKQWVWDDSAGNMWGNGGYRGSVGPDWWGRTRADITEETAYEGWDGDSYMEFSIKGARLTKYTSDGSKSESGSFSFDFSDAQKIYYNGDADLWATGKLFTKNVTILQGVSQNDGKSAVYEYDILQLDADHMVLAYKTRTGWSADSWSEWGAEAWFWKFRAK